MLALALAVAAIVAPQPAVRAEVRATFPTSRRVIVSCTRSGRTRFVCSWSDRNAPDGRSDYFGRARVTADNYGAEARLYHVRCHYCRSGVIPRNLR